MRLIIYGFIICSVMALLYMVDNALTWLAQRDCIAIEQVNIYGVHHIDKEQLRLAIEPLVQDNFLTINLQAILAKLQNYPWLAAARVSKIWPNKLNIVINEHKVGAVWNDRELLNTQGMVFAKIHDYHGDLSAPKLYGPSGTQRHVFMMLNELAAVFLPLNIGIAQLKMTHLFSYQLVLRNGLLIYLGHKNILTRLKQFVTVYSKIVESAAQVNYIDLRYSNGMAINWRVKPALKVTVGSDKHGQKANN